MKADASSAASWAHSACRAQQQQGSPWRPPAPRFLVLAGIAGPTWRSPSVPSSSSHQKIAQPQSNFIPSLPISNAAAAQEMGRRSHCPPAPVVRRAAARAAARAHVCTRWFCKGRYWVRGPRGRSRARRQQCYKYNDKECDAERTAGGMRVTHEAGHASPPSCLEKSRLPLEGSMRPRRSSGSSGLRCAAPAGRNPRCSNQSAVRVVSSTSCWMP